MKFDIINIILLTYLLLVIIQISYCVGFALHYREYDITVGDILGLIFISMALIPLFAMFINISNTVVIKKKESISTPPTKPHTHQNCTDCVCLHLKQFYKSPNHKGEN